MGLRIQSTHGSLLPLETLRGTGRALGHSIERLSSGLRINRASDDPAGLVISEQFRTQHAGLTQAIENTQSGANLLRTGEAALQEVSSLLIEIQDSILRAEGGPAEVLEVEQDRIDAILDAIDRVAQSTRFANRGLFNGQSHFTTLFRGPMTGLRVRSAHLKGNASAIHVGTVKRPALPGVIALPTGLIASGGSFGSVIIRIRGALGAEDLQFTSSVTATALITAVKLHQDFTGVGASGTPVGVPRIFGETEGSDQTIQMEIIQGTPNTGILSKYVRSGTDAVVHFGKGVQTTARGRHLRLRSAAIDAEVTLSQLVPAGRLIAFAINPSGIQFQLGDQAHANDKIRFGIPQIDPSVLGSQSVPRYGNTSQLVGGFLESLHRGSSNDLATDPTNAARIAEQAAAQVNDLRAFLGSLEADLLAPNERSLQIASSEIQRAESTVRDLDFAAETASLVRNQVLLDAGTQVLATSQLSRQNVLQLLQ